MCAWEFFRSFSFRVVTNAESYADTLLCWLIKTSGKEEMTLKLEHTDKCYTNTCQFSYTYTLVGKLKKRKTASQQVRVAIGTGDMYSWIETYMFALSNNCVYSPTLFLQIQNNNYGSVS